MTKTTANRMLPKAPTGIAGLDEITEGGLPRGRPTLVCGGPGCGKTLLQTAPFRALLRDSGVPEGIGIDVETPHAFVRRGRWAFELDQATFAASSRESLAAG